MAMPGGVSRKRKARSEQVVPGIESTSAGILRTRASERAAGSSASIAGPADPGPDYPIPNFDDVYSRMRQPETGFDIADRRWRLMHYPKCFVGTEAVEWMIQNLHMDRATAIQTGQLLMDAGIVHHVTHSEPFSDKYYFFRFQEDDESSVLNMKRIWDPSLSARPAVHVSQELLTRLACLCEKYRYHIIASKPGTPQLQSHPPPCHIPNFSQFPSQPQPSGNGTPNIKHSFLGVAHPNSSGDSDSKYHSPVLVGPGNANSRSTPSAPMGSSSQASPGLDKGIHFFTAANGSLASSSGSNHDVDYVSLSKSEEFRAYAVAAAELQRVQLLGLSHDERLAFFVNVYNALCLHCYAVKGAPSTLFRRWVFFRMLSYRVAGLDMTLDDIEHGILRGNKRAPMIKILQQLRPSDPKCQHILTHRDGRIHFVISAGTASDPPIRILNGENVQEELHDATVEFLSHSVKINTNTSTVTLPRIFMWYADDFPSPERALLEWVGQYLLAEPAASLASIMSKDGVVPTIAYENFDWCASDARFNAAVVRRKRRRLEREFAAAQAGLLPNSSPNILQGTFEVGLPLSYCDTGLFSAVPVLPPVQIPPSLPNGLGPYLHSDNSQHVSQSYAPHSSVEDDSDRQSLKEP